MSASSRAARPLSGAVAVALATLTLLSCSSGGVSEPVGDTIGDTYFLATITMRDTGNPCSPFGCDPEMYECRSRAPILAGQQWTLRGDIASAGMLRVGSTSNFAITATDATTNVGIALELTMTDFSVASPAAAISLSTEGTYADIDIACDQLGTVGPESRFDYQLNSGTVTLTAASVDGTRIVNAVSDGRGGFSPAGIVEGSFSFVGRAFQPTPLGSLTGEVLVTGCFRVNLPEPERGVPVTPTPASPSAACP